MDTKPGLYPAQYMIPRAKGEEFKFIIVKDGQRGVYLDFERGSELMVVPADTIARSLVDDYVISQPMQDQEAGPGMFWVKNSQTRETLEKSFKDKLLATWTYQRNWFSRLVRGADDLWIANHKFSQIGDLERIACRELGLKRDWLSDDPNFIRKCPVCTTLISTEAIACFACHVILDPKRLSEFQFLGGAMPVPVQALNK